MLLNTAHFITESVQQEDTASLKFYVPNSIASIYIKWKIELKEWLIGDLNTHLNNEVNKQGEGWIGSSGLADGNYYYI